MVVRMKVATAILFFACRLSGCTSLMTFTRVIDEASPYPGTVKVLYEKFYTPESLRGTLLYTAQLDLTLTDQVYGPADATDIQRVTAHAKKHDANVVVLQPPRLTESTRLLPIVQGFHAVETRVARFVKDLEQSVEK